MDINEAIGLLESSTIDKHEGLPEEIFRYISRTVPLIGVDMLLQNEKNGYLLSWRDDEFCGKGWHLPGGLLRFQETLSQRVQKSAKEELGTPVEFNPVPAHHYEIIIPGQENRGHVVAFLFRCILPEDYSPDNEGLSPYSPGYLKWFKSCPTNLLKIQEEYRRFF